MSVPGQIDHIIMVFLIHIYIFKVVKMVFTFRKHQTQIILALCTKAGPHIFDQNLMSFLIISSIVVFAKTEFFYCIIFIYFSQES